MNEATPQLAYRDRAKLCNNAAAKKLFLLMDDKKSNLALSADVTSSAELLALAEQLGPEICLLKTHIDIIRDFSPALTKALKALSIKHQFYIFEDRKFADIGHTVKEQYHGGIYEISTWADFINAHTLPGPGIISGLAEIAGKDPRGLLLLAQMSSANNLITAEYTEKTVALAKQFPEFVVGFIAQQQLSADPAQLYLTPGVHLSTEGDDLGQQYITPQEAIQKQGSDIIIVGRGIIKAKDPLAAAQTYRAAGWAAYKEKIEQVVEVLKLPLHSS